MCDQVTCPYLIEQERKQKILEALSARGLFRRIIEQDPVSILAQHQQDDHEQT